jgi:hypothetical protein
MQLICLSDWNQALSGPDALLAQGVVGFDHEF